MGELRQRKAITLLLFLELNLKINVFEHIEPEKQQNFKEVGSVVLGQLLCVYTCNCQ